MYSFTGILIKENGGYSSLCPELDVASLGSTPEEERAGLLEAATLHLEGAFEDGLPYLRPVPADADPRLTADLRCLIPTGRLPITAGRIHLMRKVNSAGYIDLLNERWQVGHRWVGEYVRATINASQQRLTFWHQADEHADWRLLKTRVFRLKEPVHELLPAFRQNRARCREHWPD